MQTTDVPFFEDAVGYESMGYSVASDWLGGGSGGLETLPPLAQTVWVMVMVVAAGYFVMGGVRALPVLLILYSAVTALVPIYVYLIGRELGAPERAARGAGWLVALSPTFVFFAGSLHKEGLILLALGLSIYHTLRLQARWRVHSFAMVVVGVGALFGLRFYLALLMTVVVATGLMARNAKKQQLGVEGVGLATMRQLVVTVAFVGSVLALGLVETAEHRLTETDEGILVEVSKARYWAAETAQSGYFHEADVSTPYAAIKFLPIGLAYFLSVPLPWQIGPIRQNIVIPETALWLMAYPFIALGFRRGFRANRAASVVILAATGGMCIIYALASGNVGIAYRMRSQVWLLWAPFAAWGWETWRERRHKATAARLATRRARIVRLGVR